VELHVSVAFGNIKSEGDNEPSDDDFEEIGAQSLVYDTDSKDELPHQANTDNYSIRHRSGTDEE
jgi:hypothetical protein